MNHVLNRVRLISAALLATALCTGCFLAGSRTDVTGQSATDDLNKMDDRYLTELTTFGAPGGPPFFASYLYTVYQVTDVHYSMIQPISATPTTAGDTTAVLVNTGGYYSGFAAGQGGSYENRNPNQLKVLEFGTGNRITSTENTASGKPNTWSERFQKNEFLVDRGMSSVVNVGNDDVLGWGRWTSDQFRSNGVVEPGCCSPNKSAHWVFGAATPNANLPTSGFATFNLIGNTSPTISDGSLPAGTLTSGTVGVAWGVLTPKIGVDLAGQIGGNAFTVKSAGGAAAPFSSPIVYDATTRSFSGTNTFTDGSKVSGFFAGSNASHIGLTYSAPIPTLPGRTADGAAAFKR